MHQNRWWIAFVILLVFGIGIYTVDTAFAVWHYLRLNQQVKAEAIEWSVLSKSDEEFHPIGKYRFTVEAKEYRGETIFQKGYLNDWAAKEAIGRLMQSPPSVLYQERDPTYSSLENDFPIKKTIYTLFLWILALYFLGLGTYVKKQL